MAALPSLAQVPYGIAGVVEVGPRSTGVRPAGQPTDAGSARGAHWLLGHLDHPLAGGLRTAADLARARREGGATPTLPVTQPALVRLLPAGLPRGGLTELVGGRSSGRFSLVLDLLAATTSRGEAAALVDLGDGLDPQLAMACGVVLERLLWLRPRSVQQALAAAEVAVGCGFPLVAVDLGEPPLPGGRGQEAAWLRLARSAQAHGGALLLASPYRVTGPAAAAVLRARGGQGTWQGSGPSPRLLVGLPARLALAKGRDAWRGPAAPFVLAWPGRIDPGGEEEAAAAAGEKSPAPGDRAAREAPDRGRRSDPRASRKRFPRDAEEGAAPPTDKTPGPRRRATGSPRPWHLRARAAMTATALAAAAGSARAGVGPGVERPAGGASPAVAALPA